MFKKNSIYQLIKNVKDLIASASFKEKHCIEKTAFTRNRKLSFQDIMYFVLGMPQKSLTTELELFFGDKKLSVSKQAFSKARYKISPLAFEDIFHLSTNLFRFTNHPKTWDGYRVFAVDGSEIAVDHNKNNETEFGLKGGNRHSYPSARLTALYDVTNDLIVDAVFTGISVGEREHAHRLLSSDALINNRGYKNLLLFDRGYPSRDLIYELEDKGFSYLIRCTHSFLPCVNECPDGEHTISDIHKGRTVSLRVIKDTSGEEPYIFVSNLFGEHQDREYHQNLYHQRWSIETKYGELKTRVRLENFSGKNPQAIRQELYAALFISNLSALIKSSAEDEIGEELNSGRHPYQLNRSYIIGAVSRYLWCLRNIRCYRDKLQQLIQHIKNVRSILRPNRHFKRKVSHHGITDGFCIRVNL